MRHSLVIIYSVYGTKNKTVRELARHLRRRIVAGARIADARSLQRCLLFLGGAHTRVAASRTASKILA